MKNIAHYCESTLNHIFQRLGTLEKLQSQVQSLVPPECQPYCRVVNFEAGVLTLAVASNVWASKLRFLTPNLLTSLRKEGGLPQLASIKIYVDPDFQRLYC